MPQRPEHPRIVSAGPRFSDAGARSPSLMEPLEPRTLLSGYSWSAAEVYLAELVNRARANPAAEASRLGINLAQGLSAGDSASIGVKEPLALEPNLTTSARAHALDMATRNFFDHFNPDMNGPTQRAHGAGYAGSAGENIGAQYASLDALYAAWMANPVQRVNILSLYQYFDATYHYDHLGVGIADGLPGSAYTKYYAADFGNPSSATRAQALVGVAFADADGNAFYGIGEGLANVRVDVASAAAPAVVVGTYTTDAAGNYQIALGAGAYTVTWSLVGTDRVFTQSVTIDSQNVRVAVRASQLVSPNQPADDHPDAGQWGAAAPIAIDRATGDGSGFGLIDSEGDTDLFSFVAGTTGLTRIALAPGHGASLMRLRLFSANTLPLDLGLPAGVGGRRSVISINLVAGRTYYLEAEATAATGTGGYALLVQGATDAPPATSTVGSGQAIAAAFAASDAPTIAFIDDGGRPVFARRNDDASWTSVDLFAAAGGLALRGSLATYTDPGDGLTYVAGVSDRGLILYRRGQGGAWTVRNLSDEVSGAARIASGLSVFIDADSRVEILARLDNGAIVSYWQNGTAAAPGNARFRYTRISGVDLAPQGLPTPAIAGNLTNWTAPDGSLEMSGLDGSGNVLLFTRPRVGGAYRPWTYINLSTITDAPALAGSLYGVSTAGRATVSGVDGDGNLWFIDQKVNGEWRARNITEAIGGPPLAPGQAGLTGYINRMGAAFVMGLSQAGELVSYRFIYKDALLMARWSAAVVSAAFPSPPVLSGELGAAFRWVGGTAIVTATTVGGLPICFTFTPITGWTMESLADKLGR